jgi:hypothetical protein
MAPFAAACQRNALATHSGVRNISRGQKSSDIADANVPPGACASTPYANDDARPEPTTMGSRYVGNFS